MLAVAVQELLVSELRGSELLDYYSPVLELDFPGLSLVWKDSEPLDSCLLELDFCVLDPDLPGLEVHPGSLAVLSEIRCEQEQLRVRRG